MGTEEACRLLDLDRQKVTDAVRDGFLPFASPVRQGQRRVWDETQFLGLYVFSLFVKGGYKPRRAGYWAGECLRNGVEGDKVVLTPNEYCVHTIFLGPARALLTNAVVAA